MTTVNVHCSFNEEILLDGLFVILSFAVLSAQGNDNVSLQPFYWNIKGAIIN